MHLLFAVSQNGGWAVREIVLIVFFWLAVVKLPEDTLK